MIFNRILLGTSKIGYIAGTGDGILTVKGKPASRRVFLLDAKSMQVVGRTKSTASGNYIFTSIDARAEYLVMARDYNKEFEPFAWDYVTPADDLTFAEQKALWQSWQT